MTDDESRPSLHERLEALGETLSPSDQPRNPSAVLGALIKVLEDGGTTVKDELFPKSQEDAEADAAAESHKQEIEQLQARIDQLEGKDQPPSSSGQPGSGPAGAGVGSTGGADT